jgi:hypothetical protein
MESEEEGLRFLLKLTALLAKEKIRRDPLPTAPPRPPPPQSTDSEVWIIFLSLAVFTALLAAVLRLIE